MLVLVKLAGMLAFFTVAFCAAAFLFVNFSNKATICCTVAVEEVSSKLILTVPSLK